MLQPELAPLASLARKTSHALAKAALKFVVPDARTVSSIQVLISARLASVACTRSTPPPGGA